jgi:hypothetical protein
MEIDSWIHVMRVEINTTPHIRPSRMRRFGEPRR